MKLGIKPVYGRIIAYSLIPIVLIILGTYGGMYLLSGDTLFVNLDNEYAEDEIEHHLLVTNQQAINLEQAFDQLENTVNLLEIRASDIISNPTISGRNSYFHDITKDKQTPRPQFSEKYNKTVDFSVSSYFVYPNTNFGNYSSSLNQSIAESSILDISLLSLYQTNPDILWIKTYFSNSGIERTYPFNGPIRSDYNPENNSLYENIVADPETKFHYSDPFLDEFTNQTVISVASPLIVDGQLEGQITLTLLLNEVISDLKIISNFQDRAFLINTDLETIYHSSFKGPQNILNSSGGLTSINKYETNSSDFVDLITVVDDEEVQYAIINYENDGLDYIVAIKSVKNFIFGLVEISEKLTVFGTFNLIELLLVPIIVISILLICILLLFRRYGFLKNLGIETLVQLEQSVKSKVTAVTSFEVEDIGEIASEQIKKKSEELQENIEELDKKAEKIKTQIKNVDQFTAAKLNEKILSFENKLFVAIDHKFETTEALIQNAKGIIPIASDQFRSLLSNPDTYIDRQLQIFGIKNPPSLEDLSELPNEVNRLIAIITKIEEVPIETLAELTNKNPEQIQLLISALPENFGLTLNETNVHIEKEKVFNNLQHFVQIYYQINVVEEDSFETTKKASQVEDVGSSDVRTSNSEDQE